MERILLIDIGNLPSLGRTGQLYSLYTHPPIGLAYLEAACREAFPRIEVRIFHTVTSRTPIDDMRELIKTWKPDLVGLRSMSIDSDAFQLMAAMIREQAPSTPLIAGGPYPSASYDVILERGYVDLVAIGEGEVTFVDLIGRMMKEGGIPRDVVGTVTMDNGALRVNPGRPLIPDLDTIPIPDPAKLNLSAYSAFSNQGFQDASKTGFLFASRGCPYQCFYCHQLFGKRIRRRSPENLVKEMKIYVDKFGVTNFTFLDDIFNFPQKAAKEGLRLIAKELPGVRLNFPNGLRTDHMDDEFIDLLEEAGGCFVAVAVETSSPRLQKLMGKHLKVDRAREAIANASRRMIVRVFYMIGFPTETYDEAMDTIRFAAELDHVAQPVWSVVKVFKGTGIYDMLKPTPEQDRGLEALERVLGQPKLNQNPGFYGDLFPREVVPLRGEDIQKLRWEWMRQVIMNRDRIRNSQRILERHLATDEIVAFYRNFYDDATFNEQALQHFMKLSGALNEPIGAK